MIFLAQWHWRTRKGLLAAAHFWVLAFRLILGLWHDSGTPKTALTLWTLGTALNGIVTLSNGGVMPTRASVSDFGIWRGSQSKHSRRLLWLGDVIHLGRWWISPGDVCLAAGTLSLLGTWFRKQGTQLGLWLLQSEQ